MKFSMSLLVWLLAVPFDTHAFARGESIQVFESTGSGGIWDQHRNVYLRFSMKGHEDVWAGLKRGAGSRFEGQVVFEQFTTKERAVPATAEIIVDTSTYKLIALSFTLPGATEPSRILLEQFRAFAPEKVSSPR